MRTHPLEALRHYRKEILRLAEHYRAHNVRVFGSVARGEAKSFSDLDLLVKFEPGVNLFEQICFEQELQDLLGCWVDVVSEDGLKPTHRERILSEAAAL